MNVNHVETFKAGRINLTGLNTDQTSQNTVKYRFKIITRYSLIVMTLFLKSNLCIAMTGKNI